MRVFSRREMGHLAPPNRVKCFVRGQHAEGVFRYMFFGPSSDFANPRARPDTEKRSEKPDRTEPALRFGDEGREHDPLKIADISHLFPHAEQESYTLQSGVAHGMEVYG